MPFGLRNAGQTFQRFINEVLHGIEDVFIYIDDILIASADHHSHMRTLQAVFLQLDKHGLRVSLKKCEWMQPQLDFFGYTLDQHGTRPTSSKTDSLTKLEAPHDYKTLRRYLGMFSFYRQHIAKFAEIVEPLQELLNSTQPKKRKQQPSDYSPFSWTAKHQTSFKALQQALAAATLLHHLSPTSNLTLTTDASDKAVGAALHEVSETTPSRPIAFYLRRLTAAEQNYSTFDKELLAIYAATSKFKHMIEGKHTTVFTDHKPLVSAINKNSGNNPRQSR